MKKNIIASIALLITVFFFIKEWFEINIPMGILIAFITILWIFAFMQFNTVSALKILLKKKTELMKQNQTDNVIDKNTIKKIILFNVLVSVLLLFVVGEYLYVVHTFEPFLIIFCVFFFCHLFIIFRTLTLPKQLIIETKPVTEKPGNSLKDKEKRIISLMAILVFLLSYISKLKAEKTILSGSLLILFYTLLFAYVFLQERIENSKYKKQIIVIGIMVMVVLLTAFAYLTGII